MRGFRLLPALMLLLGCAGDRWDRALSRMDRQPRADPYEASAVLPGGAVMQSPPPGTVPWGPAPADSAPAATPALLERGRHQFRIFCGACHGVGGYGGSVVAANMRDRPPPSLRRPVLRQWSDSEFYRVITQGVGRMPGYVAELSPHDRWAVVVWVRALLARDSAASDEREDSLRAAALAGAGP